MNEKFNKDEVWGALRGKEEEEEGDYDDGSVEDEAVNSAQTDAPKKSIYKDNFFNSLSSDATKRGRSERTKFFEQRKFDTETFGAFPVRTCGAVAVLEEVVEATGAAAMVAAVGVTE
ncbi:protein decapping 5 isoform X3 [Physcomitrium patens]|uniref:FDF domain-containing protein n=1 Tax=Physcomitrium patens TaxID=3218 RepID=A0A7I4DM09_PHYPA